MESSGCRVADGQQGCSAVVVEEYWDDMLEINPDTSPFGN